MQFAEQARTCLVNQASIQWRFLTPRAADFWQTSLSADSPSSGCREFVLQVASINLPDCLLDLHLTLPKDTTIVALKPDTKQKSSDQVQRLERLSSSVGSAASRMVSSITLPTEPPQYLTNFAVHAIIRSNGFESEMCSGHDVAYGYDRRCACRSQA